MAHDNALHPGPAPVLERGKGPFHRVCFQPQVRPERIVEYRQRHAAVWPEGAPDTGFKTLTEVFHLEDQLAATGAALTEGSH